MNKPDGGPAFPFEYHNQTSRHQDSFVSNRKPIAPQGSEQYGGMSLRDWFAGNAPNIFSDLSSMTKKERWEAMNLSEEAYKAKPSYWDSKLVAFLHYQYADAMIEQRELKS